MGQNWERAAMIKARRLRRRSRDRRGISQAAIAPFIWRRNLDFAAIEDIHSIKRQIHAHAGHGEIAVAGHNIKLGRGGIREIEFFAQTQQLILGGRNPSLRAPATLDALEALARAGHRRRREAAADLSRCLSLPAHAGTSAADDRGRADPYRAQERRRPGPYRLLHGL